MDAKQELLNKREKIRSIEKVSVKFYIERKSAYQFSEKQKILYYETSVSPYTTFYELRKRFPEELEDFCFIVGNSTISKYDERTSIEEILLKEKITTLTELSLVLDIDNKFREEFIDDIESLTSLCEFISSQENSKAANEALAIEIKANSSIPNPDFKKDESFIKYNFMRNKPHISFFPHAQETIITDENITIEELRKKMLNNTEDNISYKNGSGRMIVCEDKQKIGEVVELYKKESDVSEEDLEADGVPLYISPKNGF